MQTSQQNQLIDRLAAIPYTGAISDILDELGYPHQVLPSCIQSIQTGQTIAGRALTVHGEPAAGLARDEYFRPFLTMLGAIRPGDVRGRPAERYENRYQFGELSCETPKFRGGRGAVIDGGSAISTTSSSSASRSSRVTNAPGS